MKILVVCGAGASSTFVAQRIRTAAKNRALDVTAQACPLSALDTQLASADVVLLGSHLASEIDSIRSTAQPHGVAVVAMPASVFTSPAGDEALDLALSAAGAGVAQGETHRHATEDTFHG
ncbi:PTS system cellobiose-specific IIB component [Okibacterium sp. HSC-33S16]|uniref:PTS sugar transporter subunit IIB n=1 Tax=Okibacterium sp. HSC-33S16 TaxID=2910965 RepID=UPI00209D2AB3|nr:PTS sugar transporter [Okibacterium sp. HSC-33S16]MCP2030029.1 PTS system cellobiose-specific IIB component [Okibacterium sp. HSC-33S16]